MVDMKEFHETVYVQTVSVDVEGTGWIDCSGETGSVIED